VAKERIMRRLVVRTFLSLDGVMQAPGGPEEDPTGGFAHGGWTVNYGDDVTDQVMGEAMGAPFDLLLGRKTYEIFAAHWPYSKEEPFAPRLNDATKYVVSSTLRTLTWQNSKILTGDIAAGVSRIKGEPGPELQVYGSGQLVRALLETPELVDELRLLIFPLILGKGKRIFGERSALAGWELVRSTSSTTGVLMVTYRAAPARPAGSFASQQPSVAEIERRRRMQREQ
jgi:dihydrofolate reductase